MMAGFRRSGLALALFALLAFPARAEEPAARNVILMIADGIGFNGWLAADYYQGRAGRQPYQVVRPDGTAPVLFGSTHWALNVVDAEGRVQPVGLGAAAGVGAVEQGYDPTTRWTRFEQTFANDFAPVGLAYTSYTDSAAAGTALHTGVKTSNIGLNMDWTGTIRLRTIAEIAMDEGRSAGAVSSVQASHATPASVVAHNRSRNAYDEIFREMVASGLSVIMGGGHPLYDASGNPREPAAEDTAAFRYVGGRETWTALTGETGLNGYRFIDDRVDFESLARGEDLPARVVGILRSATTAQAERAGLGEANTPSGMAFNPAVPDLATLTVGALNVLNQNPEGFFLMSEGGAVDWMSHANIMPRFLEEQMDFNAAIAAVIDWVETHSSWDETLLIITADHETGGMWGEGTWTNGTGGPVAADRSTGAVSDARFDPAEDRFNAFLAVQDRGPGVVPGHQFASGNHTNELVPLWAIGAGSHLFAQYSRTDQGAARLWGQPYGWDGSIVDNTTVFQVMNRVLAARSRNPAAAAEPASEQAAE
jgi:alkaline phosphatase